MSTFTTTFRIDLPNINLINSEYLSQLTDINTNDNNINEINQIYNNFIIQINENNNNERNIAGQTFCNQIEPEFRSKIVSLLVRYNNEINDLNITSTIVRFSDTNRISELLNIQNDPNITPEIQTKLYLINKILNDVKLLCGVEYMKAIYYCTVNALNYTFCVYDENIINDLKTLVNNLDNAII